MSIQLTCLGLYANAERSENTYNLFDAMYYSIITITTVGYGDIIPKTTAGRAATLYYITALLFWLPSKVRSYPTGIVIYFIVEYGPYISSHSQKPLSQEEAD